MQQQENRTTLKPGLSVEQVTGPTFTVECRTEAISIFLSGLKGVTTVCLVGALSDLDNVTVGIADVAANLAVFGDWR